MQIIENEPLKNHCTMQIGGPARYFTTVRSQSELLEALSFGTTKDLPWLVLGDGSNVIFTDAGFAGLVIKNDMPGFDVLQQSTTSVIIKIGAGVNWDETVARTVEMDLSGIETLSLIPGTTGAAPVQNIGAYGQELKDTLIELEAYDTLRSEFTVLGSTDCHFSYRDSIFKHEVGRYIITSITLRLSRKPLRPPFYRSLQTYLDEHRITDYSPATLRSAVIAIRQSKLPDPAKLPNTGSFFKNPIISQTQLDKLQAAHPDIPHFPAGGEQFKIPAGWLIEQVGLKGVKRHRMQVYPKHALVLVNHGGASYQDLYGLKTEIQTAVQGKFDILLEQEPITVEATVGRSTQG